ncbi:hypothetical protein TELCIR_16695, partial [Teladorsagia circumcincta]
VVGGSLADRAGLRDGDIIDQLEGLGNLDINAVDRLLTRAPQGFNAPALPFSADPRVKHLQYNSPMNLYSNESAAEQYVQQTAGIVANGVSIWIASPYERIPRTASAVLQARSGWLENMVLG